MFAGIVEGTGTVVSREAGGKSTVYTVDAGEIAADAKIGDSIANNGCCLTVVGVDQSRLTFDLLHETERLTNLKALEPGRTVNLERSLKVDDRISGHFVTGHIDGTGIVKRFEPSGKDYILEVGVSPEHGKYLVPKGCIAVDGMSLTVVDVMPDSFTIWIIPHTREITCLRERQAGDEVNLEFDLIAKYTEKILAERAPG